MEKDTNHEKSKSTNEPNKKNTIANMNLSTKISLAALILIIIAGGSFYGGMKFEQLQKGGSRQMMAGGQGNPGGTNSAKNGAKTVSGGADFFNGQIISKNDKSITVEMTDKTGQSKIIFFSSQSQISKAATGTTTDLTVGTNVSVTGTQNSDGSLTAKMIQIRPAISTSTPGMSPEVGAPVSGNLGSAPTGSPDQTTASPTIQQ
jgi:hypothetical protein